MPITFRECALPPLEALSVSAPAGAVIGIVGEPGAGKQELLRVATGTLPAHSGSVEFTRPGRFHGPLDELVIEQALTLGLFHTLCLKDPMALWRAGLELERFRRRGGTALLVSHQLETIQNFADEVWWIDKGRLRQKGDVRETLDAYRHHLARRIREAARGSSAQLPPSLRKGDGRAVLVSVETLDAAHQLTSVWTTGQPAEVRVIVRFTEEVADPVIGILIRTRIGVEVYGTNTELEKVKLGPCRAGETLCVVFSMTCQLCPQEYTLTVASHDPDGVWHDWMEDGVAFSVIDTRYTAGVACHRAEVQVERHK